MGGDELLRAILARCRQLGEEDAIVAEPHSRWGLGESEESGNSSLPPKFVPVRLRLLLRNIDPVCLARTGHPGNLIRDRIVHPGTCRAWRDVCLPGAWPSRLGPESHSTRCSHGETRFHCRNA